MICVVGMGPGDKSYVTVLGREKIQEAEIIIGCQRHLVEMGKVKAQTYVLAGDMEKNIAYIKQHRQRKVVVLASGDPMIYGIGTILATRFGKEAVQIIPGVSAIQYLFCAIGLDMNDLYITSSHGKIPDYDRILTYPKVAMVTDGKIGPRQIAEAIDERGLAKKLIVGESLSYEDEKIENYTVAEVLERDDFKMNVVVILDEK